MKIFIIIVALLSKFELHAASNSADERYYSGIAGGVCNDATHVIRSQKECSDALKVLDITSIPISWTGKSNYIPSGCSLGKRKDPHKSFISFIPHFETSTTGLGKGRYDQTPICKGPEAKYAVDACMQFVCKSCQIVGLETIVGIGLTLAECKTKCIKKDNCLGIDFGKGARKGICWLQTEQNTETSNHNYFDSWKKTTECDYYAGNAGQVCDDENDVIRSQAECTVALESLGYQISKFWTGTFAWIPAGCSFEKSGKMKPHFEQSSTGLGKGANVLIPICKRTNN